MSMDQLSASSAPELSLLEKLQQRIGYKFKDENLLLAAVTHASGAEHRLASNERLEFLGDAILGAVVCEILYRQYPEYLEGDLTRIKSVVVSRLTCAKISESLGMQEFLILGKGMIDAPQRSLVAFGRRLRVVGGGDLSRRRRRRRPAVHRRGDRAGDRVGGRAERSAATTSRCCSNWPSGSTALRRLTNCWTRRGPITASVSRLRPRSAADRYQPAWGRNKKEAEQRAARNALNQLSGEMPAFPSD